MDKEKFITLVAIIILVILTVLVAIDITSPKIERYRNYQYVSNCYLIGDRIWCEPSHKEDKQCEEIMKYIKGLTVYEPWLETYENTLP